MNFLKKIVYRLILPLVGLCVILILFGRQWVLSYLAPPEIFVMADAPVAPQYSNAYFWVAHPDKNDTSDLVPTALDTSKDLAQKEVDVFFIHSTGFVGPDGWNSTMENKNSEAQSIEYMLSSMASIFNGCCNIYAPHYREANIQAFMPDKFTPGTQALDLAYQDVEAAFSYYLAHFNQGRPFVIVGHSQGTAHALRLLEQKIDNTSLYQQLVAAYVVGYWLPKDKFERGFQQIQPCVEANQTGCVVSFDTYGQGGELDAKVPHWYPTGWESSQLEDGTTKPTLCVNPLSWTNTTDKIPSTAHLGAMPVEFKRTPIDMLLANNPGFIFQELPELTPRLTWAQCMSDGRLEVMTQENNAFSNHLSLPNKSYHVLDYSLFYGNIRENAMQRVTQFMTSNHASQTAQ